MFNTGMTFENFTAADSFGIKYCNSLANFDSLLNPIFQSFTINDTKNGTYITITPPIHIPSFSQGNNYWEYKNNVLEPSFLIDNFMAGNNNAFADTPGIYPIYNSINQAYGVGNLTYKISSSFGNDNWSYTFSSSFGDYNTTNNNSYSYGVYNTTRDLSLNYGSYNTAVNKSASFGNYNSPTNTSLDFGLYGGSDNHGMSFGSGNAAKNYSIVYGESNTISTGNVFIGYNDFGLDFSSNGFLNFVTNNSSITLNTTDTLATKENIHTILYQYSINQDSLIKIRGYKEAVFWLQDNNPGDPLVTTIVNDIGPITITQDGANGEFHINSSGLFTVFKTTASVSPIAYYDDGTPQVWNFFTQYDSPSLIYYYTLQVPLGVLVYFIPGGTTITIRVYN
jgi:hypothetical protein